MTSPFTGVLICRCPDSEVIPPARWQTIEARLQADHIPYRALASLCGISAVAPDLLTDLAGWERVLVLACHPRAVQSLLQRIPDLTAQTLAQWSFVDLRSLSETELMNQWPSLLANLSPTPAPVSLEVVAQPEPGASGVAHPWDPWFPTLDPVRCKKCGQCVNFCLFGVYAGETGQIPKVVQPWNCKNRCPACARLCPSAAIIFPRHPTGPINGDVNFSDHHPDEALRDIQATRSGENRIADLLKRRRHSSLPESPPHP
jgi:NAD-dependent dihydropyrimidine dehydrogenase PreA subunit